MVYLFYTAYNSIDLAHLEIFHSEVGKRGILVKVAFHQSQLIGVLEQRP